jgi:hypothetical protein
VLKQQTTNNKQQTTNNEQQTKQQQQINKKGGMKEITFNLIKVD